MIRDGCCCYHNYNDYKASIDRTWNRRSWYLLCYKGAVTGLYIKNTMTERNTRTLTIEEVIRILRLVRKEKFIIYKQTATFALNIARQMRNNINIQIVEQFLNGPESPIKVKD